MKGRIITDIGQVSVDTVVARKILYIGISPKHQQMIDHLIHKITVVRHDDRTSFEVPQIFLQYIQRDDI